MVISIEKKLYKELKTAGEAQNWWHSSGILVAVSGGSDSMAMLALLHRFYSGRIVVAHLEHGLRGDASLSDAEFVLGYCDTMKIPCFVRYADVPANKMRGESSEMAGRRVRYKFFCEVMESENLDFTATGHTSGDVVETMIFHLFRGTGISGLKGIAPRRGSFVRPLINSHRDDLREFLRNSGIEWCEDETNFENCYQRNKIRNQLLPWVRQNINTQADRALLGLGVECSELAEKRTERASGILKWVTRAHPCSMAALDTSLLRTLHQQELSDLLREQGRVLELPLLDRRRMDELCRLIGSASEWRFQWARDIEVCGGAHLTGWVKRESLIAPDDISADAPADDSVVSLAWGSWRIELSRRSAAKRRFGRGVWSAAVPADADINIAVTSAGASNRDEARNIPWWSRPGWPSVQLRGSGFSEIWIPGLFKRFDMVREECSCVIIAKVFCCYNNGVKGERQLVGKI